MHTYSMFMYELLVQGSEAAWVDTQGHGHSNDHIVLDTDLMTRGNAATHSLLKQ